MLLFQMDSMNMTLSELSNVITRGNPCHSFFNILLFLPDCIIKTMGNMEQIMLTNFTESRTMILVA